MLRDNIIQLSSEPALTHLCFKPDMPPHGRPSTRISSIRSVAFFACYYLSVYLAWLTNSALSLNSIAFAVFILLNLKMHCKDIWQTLTWTDTGLCPLCHYGFTKTYRRDQLAIVCLITRECQGLPVSILTTTSSPSTPKRDSRSHTLPIV